MTDFIPDIRRAEALAIYENTAPVIPACVQLNGVVFDDRAILGSE